MANRWGTIGNSGRLFSWAQKSLQMVTAAMKLKDACFLKEKLFLSEEGNSACLSSCSGGLRPLFELCVEPTGVSGLCTGVSVPLRVVPSPTGLPSKRCPCNGFFSRVDREIEVDRHVAPPRWLISNFLVRMASS